MSLPPFPSPERNNYQMEPGPFPTMGEKNAQESSWEEESEEPLAWESVQAIETRSDTFDG